MMYEPGERDSSVQDLARDLAVVARSPNSVVLLAELGELTMAAILPPSLSEPPSLPAQPPDMDATEP